MKSKTVLILEDDEGRIGRFEKVLRTVSTELRPICWRSARKMAAEMGEHLASSVVISLDHDLYTSAGETEDPGDGLEIAKLLAAEGAGCPVIVHSSNADRARLMVGTLELAGRRVKVVLPFGVDWVETYWAKAVRELAGL